VVVETVGCLSLLRVVQVADLFRNRDLLHPWVLSCLPVLVNLTREGILFVVERLGQVVSLGRRSMWQMKRSKSKQKVLLEIRRNLLR